MENAFVSIIGRRIKTGYEMYFLMLRNSTCSFKIGSSSSSSLNLSFRF